MTTRKRPLSAVPSTLRGPRPSLLLVLLLAVVLGGAACRDDEQSRYVGENPDLSEADASPIAGTIQGSFAVSPTGEATYTIPLNVPPGAAGMAPTLACP